MEGRAALSAKCPTSLGLAWGYVISLVVSKRARGRIKETVKDRGVTLTRAEEAVTVLMEPDKSRLKLAEAPLPHALAVWEAPMRSEAPIILAAARWPASGSPSA